MATKIKFKRGTKTNLPTLAEGEPAFTTDTHEFFIGASDGNKKMGGADSGWTEPSLASGLTTSYLKYKKIGNTVIVQGDLTNGNSTGFQTPFTFPSGSRPTVTLWFPCSVDGAAVGTTNARITSSNGNFDVYMALNAKIYIDIRFEVE